jgi:tetratricopeptide (TPR) repeat protein
LYQRALAIREQQLGPQHPNTATSLNNLAALYKNQGKDKQAEPLYQRALAIDEHALGPQHPDTQTIRANYARLLRTMGREDEAAALDQP